MATERTCAECGAPLPGNAARNRCPKCLLGLGLDDSAERDSLEPPQGSSDKTALSQADILTEQIGTIIGRYKLLQEIGEGGFGVVFMAEQQEPVQRKVALKIIKAGMDTREVIARFEAERQALALMDHPNIAQVLDGGTTQTARPYFVMELVRGIPITAYCDQANLSTRERLELFIKVCRAVQHAHQKGVIHRDLKPSNVLVTLHDGEPVPKVIDFGVAKALGQKLTEKTLFTRFEQMIGTPAYMSPEQAALGGLDIDTRSDIYSLGVLLYELLTGVTPLDEETLRKGALEEIRRMIRETDPPKPSTRVATLGERLVEVAKHRHAEPATLNRLIRGDLDWITMKALEKDRQRRYETVNSLAADIEHHLRDEPVVARSPSNLYRLQKAIRRHRVAFMAGAAVVIALVLGVVVSTWQAVRATRAEREQSRLRQQAQTDQAKAIKESAKSQQVAQFLKDMLQGVEPSVALGRDTTMLREILDKTSERIGNDLKAQPEVEAELRSIIGTVYGEVGDYDKAEVMHREALAIRKKIFGNEHPDVASSLAGIGAALRETGRTAEAVSLLREALAMRRKLLGNEHPDVAISLYDLSGGLSDEGKLAEAEAVSREYLALERKRLGDDNVEVARALYRLGRVLALEKQGREAEKMLREALTLQRRLLGNDNPQITYTLRALSWALAAQDRLAEAEAALREVMETQRKVLGSEHPYSRSTPIQLAGLLEKQGKLAEAESLLRDAWAITTKLVRDKGPTATGPGAVELRDLVSVLQKEGKLAEAERVLREALPSPQQIAANEPANWEGILTSLADILSRQNKTNDLEQLFNDILTSSFQSQPASVRPLAARADFFARRSRWRQAATDVASLVQLEPTNHLHYHRFAALLVQIGDVDGYRKNCQQALARFRGTEHPNVAERMAKDCLILAESGVDLVAVNAWADTALSTGKNSDDLPFFQFAKGLAEYRQGRFAEARQWTEKVLAQSNRIDNRNVEASAVLAMAQFKSQQIEAAHLTLTKASELEAGLPTAQKDLGEGWIDWIIAHALMREARALIQGIDPSRPQRIP